MALHWQWKDKCGTATFEATWDNGRLFDVNLYEGNATLIFVNEFIVDGVEKYNVFSFFADDKHMKNCLGLSKGYENIFDDGNDNVLKKIRFNKKKMSASSLNKLVSAFAKAFDNITIEIYSEEE